MNHESRLLVVDDEPRICDFVRDVLVREGHEVDTCLSAEQALDLARQRHYHLVITDLLMPGMDGIEFVRRLKRLREGLPVIVITGHSSTQTAARVLQVGVQDYIT